jgi:meiotic recombination protein DMC1
MMMVEELLNVGINLSDITKLKQAGITTVKGVQMVTAKNLLRIKGFSEQKVEKIKEASAKLGNESMIKFPMVL